MAVSGSGPSVEVVSDADASSSGSRGTHFLVAQLCRASFLLKKGLVAQLCYHLAQMCRIHLAQM